MFDTNPIQRIDGYKLLSGLALLGAGLAAQHFGYDNAGEVLIYVGSLLSGFGGAHKLYKFKKRRNVNAG